MDTSKSTVLLENERADRFGKSRMGGYLIWTREQGNKLREIQNEQLNENNNEEIDDTSVEDKFNSN